MSWQGNEVFAVVIDDLYEECSDHMLYALSEMLYVYEAHGRGWYLLGSLDDKYQEEDDFGPFEPKSYYGGPSSSDCWLPNPFMAPGVWAVNVRSPHDLFELAFECWDCGYEMVAYAGDGDEPLERMEVYGEIYDMRPSAACATAA